MSDGERGHGSVMPGNMGRACLSASPSCSINSPPAPLTAPTPFRRVGNSPCPDTGSYGPMKRTASRTAARRGKWLTRTGTGVYRIEDARIGQPLMTLPGERNASGRLSLFALPQKRGRAAAVAGCTFRKAVEYSAESTRVLAAEYADTLRKALPALPHATSVPTALLTHSKC